MTKERKFTPPTEFPAEYKIGGGYKITLLARGSGAYPLIGQDSSGDVAAFTADGRMIAGEDHFDHDLHDIPKKQVHWANDYANRSTFFWLKSRKEADTGSAPDRIAVIRRERVEGELPQYFTEEV